MVLYLLLPPCLRLDFFIVRCYVSQVSWLARLWVCLLFLPPTSEECWGYKYEIPYPTFKWASELRSMGLCGKKFTHWDIPLRALKYIFKKAFWTSQMMHQLFHLSSSALFLFFAVFLCPPTFPSALSYQRDAGNYAHLLLTSSLWVVTLWSNLLLLLGFQLYCLNLLY